MRRLLFAAPLAVLLLATACGDDDGNDEQEQQTQAAEQPQASNPNEQPQVPDKVQPTPTPIPDTLPLVQVVAAGNTFTPTRPEFAQLPKTKIEAGGKSYEGVSLAALAEKAGAAADTVATIQGMRADGLRNGSIRFALSEIGASTVLYLDENGHLFLASSTIPAEQWLKDVTGIALQK